MSLTLDFNKSAFLRSRKANSTLSDSSSSFPFSSFLLCAKKHLYNWPCPLVGWSVGRWVGLSVTHAFKDPHVAPYWPTWPCLFYNGLKKTEIDGAKGF